MVSTNSVRTVSGLIQLTREELIKTGYTNLSMVATERTWSQLLDYSISKGITSFTLDLGMSFLEHRHAFSSNPNSDINQDRLRSIQLLADFQIHARIIIRKQKERLIAEPFRELFLAFIDFRKQSGLSNRTIQSYVLYLERFSSHLMNVNVLKVPDIDVSHIHGFIQSTAANHRNSIVYCTCSVLRVLFRYLYEHRIHPKNLSFHVPVVKCNKKSKIPSVYSKDEIQAVLAAVDRGNPKGKRDYAMLLIATRYGLRASDICKLTFDDLKWHTNTIQLRQEKTDANIVLPLFNDVGEALIDYLKYGRQSLHAKEVFLRLSAPIGPIAAPTLHSIVTEYMNKAGISIPEGKKHGSHALRHSLASALLHNNTPMPIISEILGHTNTQSTLNYLKIDILHLRDYALDVPSIRIVVMGGGKG
jgi:integrase/recombinase XerD